MPLDYKSMSNEDLISELARIVDDYPIIKKLYDPDINYIINAADIYKHVDTTQSYMLWIVAVLKRCKLKEDVDYKRITLFPDSPDNIEQIAKGRNVVTYLRPRVALTVLAATDGQLMDAVMEYLHISAALSNKTQGAAA